MAAGMTVAQVSAASGVDHSSIRLLLGIAPNRPASVSVRLSTERALLAIHFTPGETVGSARVDATGTRRRIEALLASGYTGIYLLTRLGVRPDGTLTIGKRAQVPANVARAVHSLYEELEFTPGPSAWAVSYYRGLGYLPPAWWDSDTIDDPRVMPRGIRVFAGPDRELIDDLAAPRQERIALMLGHGLDAHDIAERLGIEVRQVRRGLKRIQQPTAA